MAKRKSPAPKPSGKIRLSMRNLEGSPEYFSDQFAAAVNPWGVMLVFAKLMAQLADTNQPASAEAQVIVRMSLQHAKVMTMAMRRALKQWEAENVTISIAPVAYTALELAESDW